MFSFSIFRTNYLFIFLLFLFYTLILLIRLLFKLFCQNKGDKDKEVESSDFTQWNISTKCIFRTGTGSVVKVYILCCTRNKSYVSLAQENYTKQNVFYFPLSSSRVFRCFPNVGLAYCACLKVSHIALLSGEILKNNK